jgi:hypothetical protein
MAHQPNNLLPLLPQGPRTPQGIANIVAQYVKACITVLFWLVVAGLALGLTYILVRGIVFGVRLGTQALGV